VWRGGDAIPDSFDKRPAVSWGTIAQPAPVGTRRILLVENDPDVVHGINFNTKQLDYYPARNGMPAAPKWMIVIQATDEQGQPVANWCPRSSQMGKALGEAQNVAGERVGRGGVLDITLIEYRDPGDGKNLQKIYAVAYHPAGPAADPYLSPAQRAALPAIMARPVKVKDQPAGPDYPSAPPAYQPPAAAYQPAPNWAPPAQQGPPAYQPPAPPQFSPPAPAAYQPQPAPQWAPPAQGPVSTGPRVEAPVHPQWTPPAVQQAPAGPIPAQGLTREQLAAMQGLTDEQLVALGKNPVEVRAMLKAAGFQVPPPF
jgi:hypothetical protein